MFFFVEQLHSLGQLIKVVREAQMDHIVDSLIHLSGSQEEEIRDIAGLGAIHEQLIPIYSKYA